MKRAFYGETGRIPLIHRVYSVDLPCWHATSYLPARFVAGSMPQIEMTGDVKNKIIKVDFARPGLERVLIRFPGLRGRVVSAPQCAPQPTPPVHPPDAFATVLLVNQTALACTAASAFTGGGAPLDKLIKIGRLVGP